MKRSRKRKQKRKHFLPRLLLTTFLLAACFAASPLPLRDSEIKTTAGAAANGGTAPETPLPAYAPPEKVSIRTPAPTEEPLPGQFEEYDITLMALGDNLMHMGIVYTGKQADGTYDYSVLFGTLSEFLAAADIKAVNQETIFAGDELGFSGYPRFNSPSQTAEAIAAAGFNVVLHATNHAADQGLEGIRHCASLWEQYPGVLMTGIRGDEDRPRIPYLTVEGVTFAVLNYTYGPNMGTLDASLRGHLNMLCAYDGGTGAIDFTSLNPEVPEDIREAKENADIVIVFPHWGTEYQSAPSSAQKRFAEEMAAAGADLIIGSHPHVPQPVEWVAAGNGRRALCYYSLGNYVSTQKQAECMLEGMAWVTFHVSETGVSIAEERTGVLPLVCHYKSGPVRLEGVYPLEDYTEEMALRHGIWNYGGVPLHLSGLQEQSRETFGGMALSKEDILP